MQHGGHANKLEYVPLLKKGPKRMFFDSVFSTIGDGVWHIPVFFKYHPILTRIH